MGKENYQVQLVNVTFADRFKLLSDGVIDLLAASSTFTMDRHVYEVRKQSTLVCQTCLPGLSNRVLR